MKKLRQVPLCSDCHPQETFSVPHLSENRISQCQTVINSTDERCYLLGCEPSLTEMMRQVRIRLLTLSVGSGKHQLAAMRGLFSHLLDTQEKARQTGFHLTVCEAAPAGLDLPDWFDVDWGRIQEIQAKLRQTVYSEVKCQGLSEITKLVRKMSEIGHFGSQAEMALKLTGADGHGNDCHRPPQHRWQKFDQQALDDFLRHLPKRRSGSPLFVLLGKQFNYPQLAALLARVTWLTGLRSIEVFGFKLMRPKLGCDLASILTSPLKAYQNGDLEDVIESSGQDVTTNPSHPAIMIVNTAKTKTASPLIDNRQRVLLLRGIATDQLNDLAVASSLRLMNLSSTRVKAIRKNCMKILKKMSLNAFPDRPEPIGLHTMRHAFADAARATMAPAEAGALTGHTSPNTLRGYGKRFHSKSQPRPTRWLPQPDPQRVELLKSVWDAKQELKYALLKRVLPDCQDNQPHKGDPP